MVYSIKNINRKIKKLIFIQKKTFNKANLIEKRCIPNVFFNKKKVVRTDEGVYFKY